MTAKPSSHTAKAPIIQNAPNRLHLDKRAGAIAAAVAAEGVDDDLLTTRELAAWLGVTPTWLEIGRYKDYGPDFVRLAPQVVRYKRDVVLAWLKAREFASTSQYAGADGRSKKRA